MIYIIMGVVIVVIVWLFSPRNIRNLRPGKSKRIPYSRLAEFVNVVRRRGHGDARAVIQEHGSEKFVQFVKKIPAGEAPNIIFGFPIAPWSKEHVDVLQKELDSKGIEHHIHKADRSLPQRWLPDFVKSVGELVEVDCGIDLNKMVEIMEIALKVMGLGASSYWDVTLFAPIVVLDKAIGFKEE